MNWEIEFNPQDLWVGLYWKRGHLLPSELIGNYERRWDVWVCILPMIPLHVWWVRNEGVDDE